jgi:circadian clock protein KaiC
MTPNSRGPLHRAALQPERQAFLVDSIVTLRYIESEAEMRTLISVIKVRGSSHSRQFRVFEIGPDTIEISAPAPYSRDTARRPRPDQ